MTESLETAAFERAVEAWRTGVDSVLASIAAEVASDDPVSGAVRYALSTGGKRLRPVLCLAAMDAAGSAPAPTTVQLRAASSVELIHTYSLVHDDLPCMDDDDMRRGRPTTHRIFGTQAAMLGGYALIPLACRILADASSGMGHPPQVGARAVRELCAGAGAQGMVAGQVLDLAAEHRHVGRSGLVTIHRMKTGALFRAALRIGGVLGGAAPAAIDALGSFGERLGLAFQITDDVLDVTSDSGVLGKTAGKDLNADKSTFVAHLGVAGARRAAAAEVEAALEGIEAAGVRSGFLEGLARFAVDRDR